MASTIEKFRQPAIGLGAVALGVVFLITGVTKLLGAQFNVELFRDFGLPAWVMYAVGAVEIAAAVLVWLPRTRFFGALTICGLMMGAAAVHLLSAVWPSMILVNGVLLAAAAWVGSQSGMKLRGLPDAEGGHTAVS
jgi:putative oxidoreductase